MIRLWPSHVIGLLCSIVSQLLNRVVPSNILAMMKRVLLIGYNYYPEPTGIGKYSGEMIAWLAQKGYDCEVLTSYPYYPHWKVQDEYKSKRYWYSSEYQPLGEGVEVKIHRCPMYIPVVPSGVNRMLLDLSFFISAFSRILLLLFGKRYDYIITVAPSFQLGLLGIFYKMLRKTLLIYHIQDLQIEAAKDLKLITSQKVIDFLFHLEKFILNQSDVVSTISEGMAKKIRTKVRKDICLFPNWSDCKLFYPNPSYDSLKKELGLTSSDRIVLYSGSIGEKQGLDAVLYAAKALEFHGNLKFIICGSGPYKQKLQQLAEQLGLRNVLFCPLQPLNRFNLFLNMADVHLVIQKACASDLVMPSKLTSILGVGGLALVTASIGTSLYSCIRDHNIGLVVEPENQQALTEGIWKAVATDCSMLRKNARTYAEEFLSLERIMENFENQVLQNNGKLRRSIHAEAASKAPVHAHLVEMRALRK